MTRRSSILAAILIPGVFGAACFNTPPAAPNQPYYTDFVGGSGFQVLIDYVNDSGAFPIHAAIDADLNALYVYYSDGVVHWWNYSDASAVTRGTWTPTTRGCVDGRTALLRNHSLLVACDRLMAMVTPAGEVQARFELGGVVNSVAVADEAGFLVVGLDAQPVIEIRNLSDGRLVRTVLTGTSEYARGVSIDSIGRYLGFERRGTGVVLELDTNTTRSLGTLRDIGGGVMVGSVNSVVVLPAGQPLWVLEDSSVGAAGRIERFDSAFAEQPQTVLYLENASRSGLSIPLPKLFTNDDGSQVAYFTELWSVRNDGVSSTTTGFRHLLLSYDDRGRFLRGMAMPGQEVHVKLLDNGSLLAVSALRSVMGGSELWLSVGAPDCLPPFLVRNNITA